MHEINAPKFVLALRLLAAIEALVTEWEDRGDEKGSEIVDGNLGQNVQRHLSQLSETFRGLGSNVALDMAAEATAKLMDGALSYSNLAKLCHGISDVFRRELHQSRLIGLNASDVRYYDKAAELLGEDVINAFPSTAQHIDEAGKCYALGRHTACVFHLMLMLEIPLQVIGKIVLPKDPKPNWDPVLKKIDAELVKPAKECMLKGDKEFYGEVSAHMHAVKVAWRNRTMHVGDVIPPDRAKAIFDASVGLMKHIATGLTEDGEKTK